MKVPYENEDGTRKHFDTPEEYRAAVDETEAYIVEGLGPAGALEAISKALSYDVKEEIYSYIMRVYELED